MWTIFLIVFVVCLVHDYISEGGSFVFFSRFVEFSNSFRAQTPRGAIISRGTMKLEYKFGKRLYALIVPFPQEVQKWSAVGTPIDGIWTNVTKEVEYFAGPAKDFGGIPIKPEHINENFTVLSFAYSENEVIHVKKGEIIPLKLAGGRINFAKLQPKA